MVLKGPITIEETSIIIEQMKKCICKIIIKELYEKKGTGFFCNIPDKNKNLQVLITSNNLIDENYINHNNKIFLTTNDDQEYKEININLEHNRKIYINEYYAITIIEIKSEDNISNSYFLDLDEDYLNPKTFDKNSIYALQYIEGEKAGVSFGSIKNIDDYQITHSCNIYTGSSGSPILSLSTNKVIGMHIDKDKNIIENKKTFSGIFFNYAIDEYNNNINLIKTYKEKDFKNEKLIANGAYGYVFSSYSIKDNEEVCLKKIAIEKMRINYESNKKKIYIMK